MTPEVLFKKGRLSVDLTSQGPIDLTDQDPVIVELYLQWLDSRMLPPTTDVGVNGQYLCLYVLGEKLLHGAFQNVVLDALIDACKTQDQWISGSSIGILYQETASGSPMRRLMVDM